MATTYSTNLLIALQGTGDNPGTWGTITNGNLGTVIEEAIVSKTTSAMGDANVTLTMSNGPASSPARCFYIDLTGTNSAIRTLTVPNIQKTYIVKNSTVGGFAVTVASAGGGTTVTVNNGKSVLVYVNGSSSGISQQFSDLVSGTTINNSTIADLTSVQTFTNKTLTAPTITTPTITGAIMSSITNTGTVTFPTATTTLVGTATTDTLTNKRITDRVTSTASTGTPTPDVSTTDQFVLTALAVPATFGVPTGSPTDGQKLIIRILDNGTARALTWTTTSGGYRVIGTTLPTTTVVSKTTYVGCIYNTAASFWDVVAVVTQA
jgi:hypothetical protein